MRNTIQKKSSMEIGSHDRKLPEEKSISCTSNENILQLGMAKSEVSSTQKMLNVWAIILIIWSFYRATFKMNLPVWFDEFIAKPMVFLFPIYWFITKLEKKTIFKWNRIFEEKYINRYTIWGLHWKLICWGSSSYSNNERFAISISSYFI